MEPPGTAVLLPILFPITASVRMSEKDTELLYDALIKSRLKDLQAVSLPKLVREWKRPGIEMA